MSTKSNIDVTWYHLVERPNGLGAITIDGSYLPALPPLGKSVV